MGKLLMWVAIGLAAWVAWRFVVLSQRRRAARASQPDASAGPGARPDGAGRPDAPGPTPELMMQCAVCGIHLPGSEARFARGRVYCSDAHRDQPAEAAREDAGRAGRD